MVQRSSATRTDGVLSRPGGLGGLQEMLGGLGSSIRAKGRGLHGGGQPSRQQPRGAIDLKARLLVALPRLGLALAALLLIAAAGLFIFRVAFSDRIYPAITVGDVPVGGLTIDQAQKKLENRAAQLENNTVTFTYEGKTWNPTLSEIGAKIDVSTSLDSAKQLGRSGDVSDRLAFTGDILRDDQNVPLQTTIDTGALNAWFDKVDADINHRAVDANIVIDGKTAKITPDATGVIVDRAAATQQITKALTDLQTFNVALPTVVEQPHIRAADLQSHYSELEAALQNPITVDFEDQQFTVDPTTLTQYLTVKTSWTNGAANVDLTLDSQKLATDLNSEYADKVNRDPVDAQVAWDNDSSSLVATKASVDGVTLKPMDFAKALSAAFLGGNKKIDMPVVITKPEVDSNNLGALGITQQIATGDSDFSNGTPERDNNIYVGINLLNGTLVKPGGTFSFNGAIGEITEEKGYDVAGVIVGESIGRDVGGGICQVSTTTFRAALLAGFPITEWWPHLYRLTGYEPDGWGPGYDASILQEGEDPSQWGDFKFTNNSPGWILVSSWTDYPKAYVRIYGTDDGRKVEFSKTDESDPIKATQNQEIVDDTLPPGTIEQTEWPEDGLDVGFTRIVTAKDGTEMSNRYFESDYQAHGNVWRVSPDMQGKSPASTADASSD